ncbi:major facilitator superfamily domain-containing protein 10-like isoform X2 [Centruroides vittatus]|uniref:major facilitator superfamily domain-containing protein 10-like isoform X2 n=1 Tax=Centruroides vittatus TaxID=120091 RepID=UPI00350FE95F
MEQKKINEKSTISILFVSLIIDLLGFTVILPLLPSLLEYYSQHDKQGLYHWIDEKLRIFQDYVGLPNEFNKVLFGGFIGSMFSCLQFFSAPIMGALSDVYGRKPILLLSMFGIAVSYAVWSCSNNFGLFVLARIIGGLSKGNITLSAAIVADVSDSKSRAKGMALIGIAFAIGFVIGPMIGAAFSIWIGHQDKKFFVIPALFALILAVLDIIFIAIFFEESLPEDKRAKNIGSGIMEAYNYISPSSLFTFKPVQNIKIEDLRILQNVGFIYFIYLLLYSGLEYSLTFLTHVRFNYTSMQQGKLYFFSGIIMMIVQGGYVRRISSGNESKTAVIGLMSIIPSFIIIGIAPNQAILYLGLAIYSFDSLKIF